MVEAFINIGAIIVCALIGSIAKVKNQNNKISYEIIGMASGIALFILIRHYMTLCDSETWVESVKIMGNTILPLVMCIGMGFELIIRVCDYIYRKYEIIKHRVLG